MNLYFVHDDGTIVTPELTGTILEGVTRASIIDLAGDPGPQGRGAPVLDRRVARRRRLRADHRGLRLRHRRRRHPGRAAAPGATARSTLGPTVRPGRSRAAIRQALVDIQYGRAEDTFGWMHRLV